MSLPVTALTAPVCQGPDDAPQAFPLGCWRVVMVPVAALSRVPIPVSAFSSTEWAQWHAFATEKRRREWLCGRYAAKLALQQMATETGQPVPLLSGIQIENSSHESDKGRPVPSLKGYVSISHSHGRAVAVASEHPVGVDLEKLRTFSDATVDMAFTPRERALVAGLPVAERDRRLSLHWCFKEAFMKAHGQGVFGSLGDLGLIAMKRGRLSWELSCELQQRLSTVAITNLAGYGMELDGYALVVVGKERSERKKGNAGEQCQRRPEQ